MSLSMTSTGAVEVVSMTEVGVSDGGGGVTGLCRISGMISYDISVGGVCRPEMSGSYFRFNGVITTAVAGVVSTMVVTGVGGTFIASGVGETQAV